MRRTGSPLPMLPLLPLVTALALPLPAAAQLDDTRMVSALNRTALKIILVPCLAALLSAAAPASVDCGEYGPTARESLRCYGVASDVDSLLNALTHDARPVVRIIAADLLTSLHEKRAIPIMRSAVESEPAEDVLSHLGKDLLELQGEEAHGLVSTLFTRTREADNRIDLAGALAGLGDFTGYPDVLAGMDSQHTGTQWHADFALGNFIAKCSRGCSLSPPPVDVGLRLLTSEDHSRRLSALISLSHRLDDPRVVAALEAAAATDHDDVVKGTAKVFLDQAAREKRKNHAG
jgi:hypothetical protein